MATLNSDFLAITGRVRSYYDQVQINPQKSLMPFSCTVYDTRQGDLQDLLVFTSNALKGGAGVKVQLGGFVAQPRRQGLHWVFTLDDTNPDIKYLDVQPTQIRRRFRSYKAVLNLQSNETFKDHVYKVAEFIKVDDTLRETPREGFVNIQESWKVFTEALLNGKTPVLDLTALRPAGTESSNGLIATGALGSGSKDPEEGSFVSIYDYLFRHIQNGDIISLMQLLGQINRCIRKGRKLKTGIVCTALDYDSPYIERYLNFPLKLLIGSQKKAVRLDADILKNPKLTALVVAKCNEESVFLENRRRRYESPEEGELFSNVCEEVLMSHKTTCLLSHVQGGALRSPQDIEVALVQTAEFLCGLYESARKNTAADLVYAPKDKDKQVGVGWLGFSNFLHLVGVTHSELAYALKRNLDILELTGTLPDNILDSTKADEIVFYLVRGYRSAAMVGRRYGLKRMFTMAPCQSIYENYQDTQGNTTSKSIDPPFKKRIKRVSDATGVKWFYFGKQETVADVGSTIHEMMWNQWQRLMNTTGMAHSMSYDLWEPIDDQWFRWFLGEGRHPSNPDAGECHLTNTYYNMGYQLNQSYLNKGVSMVGVESEPPACEIGCPCTD